MITMACLEKMPATADSEREEGEIIDELDDLSDISSEEEYLLRQRLQVLENYNNVLERKEAKRTDKSKDEKSVRHVTITNSANIIDGNIIIEKCWKDSNKYTNLKVKKKREGYGKTKESKRKKGIKLKKRIDPLLGSESSEDTDYEYKNKIRKLANAVSTTQKSKTDTTLKERLMNMLCIPNPDSNINNIKNTIETLTKNVSAVNCLDKNDVLETKHDQASTINTETIVLSTDDDVKINESNDEEKVITNKFSSVKTDVECILKDSVNTINLITREGSDEDIETLRQHALKSKTQKHIGSIQEEQELDLKLLASDDEDEDSDTAELRVICLRSALLKKAIEMKQKQKMEKRLSQSTLYDDVLSLEDLKKDKDMSDNNTDIESVDMDIGSDHEDTVKDSVHDSGIDMTKEYHEKIATQPRNNQDTMDEDEDLLRAKLLTSLNKNLQHIMPSEKNKNITEKRTDTINEIKSTASKGAEKTRFIINTADSDSEGEHEATKNLTKMHIKLSEHNDFQQRLDMFLKSKRMEVEKTNISDIMKKQNILPQKSPQKFIPKAVNHLPESEQQEYKNLVKRMAELEKIKQARQNISDNPKFLNTLKGPLRPKADLEKIKQVAQNMPENANSSITQKGPLIPMAELEKTKQARQNISENPISSTTQKDPLKPRNVEYTQGVDIDGQISLSRKLIAEESAKVLKIKEEGLKLSQKYKIVTTELKNLATALSLNKKEYKSAQINLSKMRNKHQLLLKRSVIQSNSAKHDAKYVKNLQTKNVTKPTKQTSFDNYKNPLALKNVRVSVVNDIQDKQVTDSVSLRLDVTNNLKTVTMTKRKDFDDNIKNISIEEKEQIVKDVAIRENNLENCDYRSPLQAFCSSSWDGDPNGVLCPFEVSGSCKDDKCKFIHSNTNVS